MSAVAEHPSLFFWAIFLAGFVRDDHLRLGVAAAFTGYAQFGWLGLVVGPVAWGASCAATRMLGPHVTGLLDRLAK